jgi:predicted RNA binding protein YcfA (HicA-like mRNA interferase family)
VKSSELIRYLKKHGAKFVAHGKGAHQHWEREGRRTVVVIRGSNKRVGNGLIHKICKDLGIPPP